MKIRSERRETQKGGIIVNQNPENRNSANSYPSSERPNYGTPNTHNYPNGTQPARQRPAPNGGQQQMRRALTEEERRRIDAARRAAAQRRMENPNPQAPERAQRPARPRNVPQGNAQGHRQRAALVNDPRQQADRPVTQQSQASRDRARRKVKPNGGLILFLLIAAVIVGVSIWQIVKNADGTKTAAEKSALTALADVPDVTEIGAESEAAAENAAQHPDTAQGTPSDNTPDPTAAASAEIPDPAQNEALPPDTPSPDPNSVNLTLYDTETVSNSMLDEGTLILVNASHPYEKADSIEVKNAFDVKNGDFKVSSSTLSLAPAALDAFVRLASAFAQETGSHDLLLNSGYRTVAEQQDVRESYLAAYGEDYVRAYVASPGESEHHTGLACDLTFYTDDGQNIPIPDYRNGSWITSYASDYGFILRYPENKSEITGIANEPWHFRYVGIPHSYVCEAKDWCLEEYVENIRNYTAEGTLLYVTNSGEIRDAEAADGLPTGDGWLIYSVPKESGSSTSFKVVRGYDYEISGTNDGGFIVTVILG